ncbi:MAG: hypothetical protein RL217_792 [Pseudomonadota bacterium]|jgi:four helix bundle protein
MRKYQELDAWQHAMELSVAIYHLTANFPDNERYGLVSQMRRAAVSVPSNIAEGHGRDSELEFKRFLLIARGSLAELETQWLLAQRIGLAGFDEQLNELMQRVFSLLNGLINYLKRKIT